jgi:hypothetical protein
MTAELHVVFGAGQVGFSGPFHGVQVKLHPNGRGVQRLPSAVRA